MKYTTVTIARIVATLLVLYLVGHVISLIRYYLRLAAFYDARGDAILMTNPERAPRSEDIETFDLNAHGLTPADIGFGRRSLPAAEETTWLSRAVLRTLERRADRSAGSRD